MLRTHLRRALTPLLVASVLAFYGWTIAGCVPLPPFFGAKQSDYFNLLADGFLKGHLYLDVKPDPRLAASENPYDPAKRPLGSTLHDAAYYEGLYYLYFGAAPVVTLFLPWRLATGFDLPLPYAVLLFTSGGFLCSVGFWLRVRRLYFPDSGMLAQLCVIPVLGLAVMSHAALRRPNIWEVPIAAGYCFSMAALACVPGILRGKNPVRPMIWAGLFLGLAVGSRPTYAVAAPMLAAPLICAWIGGRRGERLVGPGSLWRTAAWGAASFGAIIAAILWYNDARFGSAFDFGFSYQLTDGYEAARRHFAAAFVPTNLRLYYLSPAQWGRFFPFVHQVRAPSFPDGYYGIEYAYGILPSLPFACLALAAPLGLLRREPGERAQLAAILGSIAILYATVGAFLLFYFSAVIRYMMDFTPALMLLAGCGLLAVERLAPGRWRALPAGAVMALLAAVSVFFGIAANFQLYGLFGAYEPGAYRTLARWFNTPVWWSERMTGFPYGPLEMEIKFPEGKGGAFEPLVTTGWAECSDYLFVLYHRGDRKLQFGFDHTGYGVRWMQPVAVDFRLTHKLRVEMGSLYAPQGDPFYAGRTQEEVTSLTQTLRVSLDGRVLAEDTQAFYDSSPEAVRVGDSATGAYGGHFTGTISEVRRGEFRWLEPRHGVYGMVALDLVFPRGVPNRGFPLVTSGKAGRGDSVYVRIARDGQARFGYDHWGLMGVESDPVAFDPAATHRVEIRYGGLLPPARTAAGRAVREVLVVRLDGAVVWTRSVPFYPSTSEQITVGHNLIGFSTSERDFAGRILGESRVDSEDEPLAPEPRR